MKLRIILALVAIGVMLTWQTEAQTYDTNNVVVQTFAGSGFSGSVDGVGQQTMFYYPTAIVADSQNNLFVTDYWNNRVRKITPDGTVSTFSGGGSGSLPGYGTNVALPSPWMMTIDHANTLYFVCYNSSPLLRVRSDGYASTISLNGLYGSGLCVDSGNNVYISDPNGPKIYRYRTTGVLEVFAGSGNSGSLDGNGIFTSFLSPSALAADSADNIYVYDGGLIRRINQNRDVVTIAGRTGAWPNADGVGTNAAFSPVTQMCFDNLGNLILACRGSGSCIRKMTAATQFTTLAGSFTQNGYVNGPGNLARFNTGSGLGFGTCVSGGTIFVADSDNHRIRSITFNPSTQPVLPANLQLSTYPGLQITGTVGRTYQVQSSADMTNWTTRATLLLNSSPYLWIDQNPVSGSKFYRALLLP